MSYLTELFIPSPETLSQVLEVATDEYVLIPVISLCLAAGMITRNYIQQCEKTCRARLLMPEKNSTGTSNITPMYFNNYSKSFSLIWNALFRSMTKLNNQKIFDFTSASTHFKNDVSETFTFTYDSFGGDILALTNQTALSLELKNQIRLAFYFKKLKDPKVAMAAAEAIAIHFNLPKHPANITPSDLLPGLKVAAENANNFLNTHIYEKTETDTFWRVNPRHQKIRNIKAFLITLSTEIKTPRIIPTPAEIMAFQIAKNKVLLTNALTDIPNEIQKRKNKKYKQILAKMPKAGIIEKVRIYIQNEKTKLAKKTRIQTVLKQLPKLAQKAKSQAEAKEANKAHFEHVAQTRALRIITPSIRNYLATKGPKAQLQQLAEQRALDQKRADEAESKRLAESKATQDRLILKAAKENKKRINAEQEAKRVQDIILKNEQKIADRQSSLPTPSTRSTTAKNTESIWRQFSTTSEMITPPATPQNDGLSAQSPEFSPLAPETSPRTDTDSLSSTEVSSVDITPPVSPPLAASPTPATGAGAGVSAAEPREFKFNHKDEIKRPLQPQVRSMLTEIYNCFASLKQADGSTLFDMTDIQFIIGGSSVYNIKSGAALDPGQDIDIYILKNINLGEVYTVQAALHTLTRGLYHAISVRSDIENIPPRYHQLNIAQTDSAPPVDITFYTQKPDGKMLTIEEISAGNLTYHAADKMVITPTKNTETGELLFTTHHLTNASHAEPHDGRLIPGTKITADNIKTLMKQVYPILFHSNGSLIDKTVNPETLNTLNVIRKHLLTQTITADGTISNFASPLKSELLNYSRLYPKQILVMRYVLRQDFLEDTLPPSRPQVAVAFVSQTESPPLPRTPPCDGSAPPAGF